MSAASSSLRILVLEDNADDVILLTRALRRAQVECTLRHVDSEAGFLAQLATPPDLILADYQLPDYDALAALRALRTRGIEVPVIVVSGTIGEEAAVECLREGATDYLLKDRLGRLGQAIRNALEAASLRCEQRRTAEELRASEERYRSLVEEAPHPIWVVDAHTLRFLEVNRKAISHYGYSREEFLAMSVLDIRPPDEIPATLEAIAEILAGRSRIDLRRHLTKGGRRLEVSVASRPVTFAGRPALLAIVDDVTERNQLEKRLRQAQKLEAIGQLAGGIAHDFNNLLTAILAYSALLCGRAGGRRDLLEPSEEIRDAAERAAALTRQLLAFSRQQTLEPRVIDLNHVVVGVESMLRRLLGEHLGLVLRLRAEPCPVLVDRGKLEQVIVNLAVNARDAMPDGGRLTIATGCIDAGVLSAATANLASPADTANIAAAPHVVLEVSDTGCGMDAETRAHIFEPFFTTKEPGRGTGLGLSTVYGIVHQSGGQLAVASELGGGSTFTIFLPRAAGKPEPIKPPPPRVARRGAETVLLLEDDPLVRRLVRGVLEQDGYTVLAAEAPTGAISVVEQYPGPIHLVLSDVVMPEMSGPEVAARLAALRPGARFLFMSGYPGGTGHRHPLPEGAELIGKPFSIQSLLHKVRQVLDAAAPAPTETETVQCDS
jgi:two-component system cell cycle sensor histidine kinase/response regulator CckA